MLTWAGRCTALSEPAPQQRNDSGHNTAWYPTMTVDAVITKKPEKDLWSGTTCELTPLTLATNCPFALQGVSSIKRNVSFTLKVKHGEMLSKGKRAQMASGMKQQIGNFPPACVAVFLMTSCTCISHSASALIIDTSILPPIILRRYGAAMHMGNAGRSMTLAPKYRKVTVSIVLALFVI